MTQSSKIKNKSTCSNVKNCPLKTAVAKNNNSKNTDIIMKALTYKIQQKKENAPKRRWEEKYDVIATCIEGLGDIREEEEIVEHEIIHSNTQARKTKSEQTKQQSTRQRESICVVMIHDD